MRRVVVTGLGIVSPAGNNAEAVLASLKARKSGISASEATKEHGFRSQIAGAPKIDVSEHVEKRTLRFIGPGAALPISRWARPSRMRGSRRPRCRTRAPG